MMRLDLKNKRVFTAAVVVFGNLVSLTAVEAARIVKPEGNVYPSGQNELVEDRSARAKVNTR